MYFATILGVAKTAALATILTPGHPRTEEWAYAGLVFVYGGAATSHLAAGDGPDKWAMPLFFAAATQTDLTSGVRLRLQPTLTPRQVATAIADSAHHGRGEVTVPRWLAPMGLVEELTPTPVLWWLERFVGGTEYGGYDPARRKDYLDRIRHR